MKKAYVLAPLVLLAAVFALALPAAWAASAMPTGVHWANAGDYRTLRNAGIDFAVTTVASDKPSLWAATLRAAESARMKLVIGAYPPPYALGTDGRWKITPDGIGFLRYLRAHPSSVMAVFVFNEPYWKNPIAPRNNPCGALTAAQLRSLRSAIRNVWPGAKIYDDIGSPSAWIPGGAAWRPCTGDKYTDQTGVADYVGIWKYPFTSRGFDESSLSGLRSEASFVTKAMHATPILLGQSYAMPSNGLVFPTRAQLRKWNCDLRSIRAGGISWYVWRQKLYTDQLSNHPDYLPDVVASAC